MISRRPTTFARLQKRIENELGIRAGRFKRTYAGRWMESQGAFKWTAIVDDIHEIGSMYTATELLKAKCLCINPDGEIFPAD